MSCDQQENSVDDDKSGEQLRQDADATSSVSYRFSKAHG